MLDALAKEQEQAMPLVQGGDCQIYQVSNETGEGTMAIYEVFPGAMVMYNDFHLAYYNSAFRTQQDLLCIDYCREGRMEYAVGKDAYSYVEAGDLKIDRRLEHAGHFALPLSHYHGISVILHLPLAAQEVVCMMGSDQLDLSLLQKKFCPNTHPKVIHGAPSIDHLFQQLYAVPGRIKRPYFRVKIMELLLYLEALELGNEAEKPYFYRSQVEAVKAARTYLVEHLDRRITLEELSKGFQLPLTTLKACFKTVYGSPVNTYMRNYRMDRAAIYLRQEPTASVTEIAGRVGYDSASKFAAAFKAVKGVTPLTYRRSGGPDWERRDSLDHLEQSGLDGADNRKGFA